VPIRGISGVDLRAGLRADLRTDLKADLRTDLKADLRTDLRLVFIFEETLKRAIKAIH